MRKTWLVYSDTVWRGVWRLSFLFFMFFSFLWLAIRGIIWGGAAIAALAPLFPVIDNRPMGIVDHSGLPEALGDLNLGEGGVMAFPTLAAAEAAWERGELQGYVEVPADYLQQGKINIYGKDFTTFNEIVLYEWMRDRVRAQVPGELVEHIIEPIDFDSEVRKDTTKEISATQISAAMAIGQITFLLQMMAGMAAGYMFQGFSREGKFRIFEVILTSVSALQFTVGRFLGLFTIGLIRVGVFFLPVSLMFGLLFLIQYIAGGNPFGDLSLEWAYWRTYISLLAGLYVFQQVFGALTGIMRTRSAVGAMLLNVLLIGTVVGSGYALYVVPAQPDTLGALIASLFPLTAPVAMTGRLLVSEVPRWQLILSQVLLWGLGFVGCMLLYNSVRTSMFKSHRENQLATRIRAFLQSGWHRLRGQHDKTAA